MRRPYLIASMTFTRDDRTLLGDAPAKVARVLADEGADVIGVNCSGGPVQLLRIVKQMAVEAVPEARFWVKPNAGWPEQVGGRIMYPATPNTSASTRGRSAQAGASVIGGCCGTTPEHIAAMRAALDAGPGGCHAGAELEVPCSAEQDEERARRLTLSRRSSRGKFVVAVEMDPPRGLVHPQAAGGGHAAGRSRART